VNIDRDQAEKQSIETINGKLEPDRVPQALRLKLFFYRWSYLGGAGYHNELSKVLSALDHQILSEYAAVHQSAVEKDAERFEAAADEIVMTSDGLSAIVIATRFDEAYSQRQNVSMARYEQVLSAVTVEGRGS